MKKTMSNKNDKILTPTSTTSSKGLSSSANITTESEGASDDNNNSLFPNLQEEKSWSSKTTRTVDDSK